MLSIPPLYRPSTMPLTRISKISPSGNSQPMTGLPLAGKACTKLLVKKVPQAAIEVANSKRLDRGRTRILIGALPQPKGHPATFLYNTKGISHPSSLMTILTDHSLSTLKLGGGATKWENRGFKTLEAKRDRVKFCSPPPFFFEWVDFFPPKTSRVPH